jgi:hypothetical protein
MHRLSLVFLLVFVVLLPARAAENGVITGTVRLKGNPPAIPKVFPASDLDVCGERARATQVLLFGTNQTVQGVIVYLGAVNGKSQQTNGAEAVLDQRDCEFVPRVQIARSGASLILRNSDPVLHVVRVDSMSGTNEAKTLLNVATPYAGFEKKYQLPKFRELTLLKATCANGHDWKAAYIAVMPHPWAAITDENGSYTLRDVPPGTYKLYAWHEVLGTLAREVKVKSEGVESVNLEFSSPSPRRAAP